MGRNANYEEHFPKKIPKSLPGLTLDEFNQAMNLVSRTVERSEQGYFRALKAVEFARKRGISVECCRVELHNDPNWGQENDAELLGENIDLSKDLSKNNYTDRWWIIS